MGFRGYVIVVVAWVFGACGSAQPEGRAQGQLADSTIEDGEALLEQNDYTEAAQVFTEIVDREPNNAKAHYYLGLSMKNLGDLAAAEAHYKLAINYDANLAAAHNNLGLLLLDKGDLVQAEAELKIYLQQRSDDAAAHYNYGLVLEEAGKVKKAQEYYETAAELDPEDPFPLLGMGDLARKKEQFSKALTYYQKAKKVAPDSPELVLKEGQTLLDLKRLEEAIGVLDDLKTIPRVDPSILATAGVLLARFDEDARAATFYRAALANDANYAAAHFLLANALARKKAFTEAAEHFERFLAISPDAPEADTARKRLNACRANMPQ